MIFKSTVHYNYVTNDPYLKRERTCRDIKTNKQVWDGTLATKLNNHFHITTLHKYTFFRFSFFYSSYTYVGLYGSGYFNFVAKVLSQSCSCAFSVLISLHVLSFFENVFIILV